MGIKAFFKKAFSDMKKSAKAQHAVDKANLAAAKAEARATWEEAKMTPAQRQAKMQEEREAQIKAAAERRAAAEARIEAAKKYVHHSEKGNLDVAFFYINAFGALRPSSQTENRKTYRIFGERAKTQTKH